MKIAKKCWDYTFPPMAATLAYASPSLDVSGFFAFESSESLEMEMRTPPQNGGTPDFERPSSGILNFKGGGCLISAPAGLARSSLGRPESPQT